MLTPTGVGTLAAEGKRTPVLEHGAIFNSGLTRRDRGRSVLLVFRDLRSSAGSPKRSPDCSEIAAIARPPGDPVTSRRRMLGGAASLGLLVAAPHAIGQRPVKAFRIGYLSLRAGPNAWDEAFVQRLRELGYRIGDNLLIEYRWAGEDLTLLERQADELVRLPVDVIVTAQAPAVRIVKKATATIPIVMVAAADPVGAGLIANFARPGGNVTGLSVLTTDLAAKRLQFLRELVPGATRIAVLFWDIAVPDAASKARGPTMLAETEAAGRLVGAEVRGYFFGSAGDLPQAFAAIEQARSQALIVKNNSLTYELRAAISETSKRLRLPDMYEARELVVAGGLVSYGPDATDLYRQAASYVERIFKGAKPADLPVQQPTKFDLVFNLKTAKAIGLTVPQSLLLRADEVIQ